MPLYRARSLPGLAHCSAQPRNVSHRPSLSATACLHTRLYTCLYTCPLGRSLSDYTVGGADRNAIWQELPIAALFGRSHRRLRAMAVVWAKWLYIGIADTCHYGAGAARAFRTGVRHRARRTSVLCTLENSVRRVSPTTLWAAVTATLRTASATAVEYSCRWARP